MPASTRDKKRDRLCMVRMNSAGVYYGFKTREFTGTGISDGDLNSQLGWILPPSTIPEFLDPNSLLIIGANAPKPPRFSKKTTAGETSTGVIPQSLSLFCSPEKISNARASGWTLAKKGIGVKFVSENSSARQMTCFVKVSATTGTGDFFYGFSCDKSTFTNYGAILGLQSPQQLTSEQREKRCFVGTSSPKPKRASLKTASGNVSTFCGEDKIYNLISEGWGVSG
ncbi:MAG: hypothetical protein ACRC78_12655 [Planktothrix sp.]